MSIDDVLGMNRRNIDYIMELNRRSYYTLVDDKLITKKILNSNRIPTANLIAVCDSFFGIEEFLRKLSVHSCFVIKPSRGSGGNGIVVVREQREGGWRFSNKIIWDQDRQFEHLENILYGTFSLDSIGDTAFAEELIITHPELRYFTDEGLPDIRIIIHHGDPIISMLRVPTRRSHGKANLHAGGFALGINLASGITGYGWYRGRYVHVHPESGVPLTGKNIPFWKEIVTITRRLYEFFPLGYMGVDFSIDAAHGPLILELNARPGLEIQNVAGRGIRSLLQGSEL
jgi:alpha-L-glutamate ligase-like protein